MFLLFVLGRKDVLPVDDLGVQKAVKRIYRLRKLPSKKKFEQLAKNWHPYCSIATLYLWRSGETIRSLPNGKGRNTRPKIRNYPEVRNCLLDECTSGICFAIRFLTLVPLETEGMV